MSPREKIVFAADCPPCECCGEPWCEEHDMHYADCPCLGPHSEENLGGPKGDTE